MLCSQPPFAHFQLEKPYILLLLSFKISLRSIQKNKYSCLWNSPTALVWLSQTRYTITPFLPTLHSCCYVPTHNSSGLPLLKCRPDHPEEHVGHQHMELSLFVSSYIHNLPPSLHTSQLHYLVPTPNSSGYPLLMQRPHHSEEQVGKLRQTQTPTLLNARTPDSSLPQLCTSSTLLVSPSDKVPNILSLSHHCVPTPNSGRDPYTTQGYTSHQKPCFAACLPMDLFHSLGAPNFPSLSLCLVESLC